MKRFLTKWIIGALVLCMVMPLLACKLFEQPTESKGLVISEVSTTNGKCYEDEKYGSPDWIELHNESDRPVNLFGWGITDNIKNTDKACTLPEITVPADGYLLLLATKQDKTDALAWDGTSPICLGFSLKSAGETLVLIDPNLQAVEELEVPALLKDVTYARRDDGSFGYCSEPTPGKANTTPIGSTLPEATAEPVYEPITGVEINEVSSRNTQLSCGGCESCDWIELYNSTNSDISLVGFTLCDDPSDFDDANLTGVLPAGGYLVLYCCKENCETKDSHPCVRLGVSRYGDELFLYDANGNEIAKVTVPAIPEKDMTYARRNDGTYGYCKVGTPGAANTEEITDEPPVEETPEPKDDDNEKEDPTLNAKRPETVRISEALAKNVYSITDRDGDHSDWVELYNTSDQDVSLNGYYLSDNPNNLIKWAFPENTTIPARGYLLVFLSGKSDVEGELHAGFSLGEGETLFLYCHADKTLDWVTIPQLKDNVSVGLDADNTQVYYRQPTPLAPNGHAEKDAEAIGFFQPDGVYISEVCAIHDRGSGENDWIEFYNGGDGAVSLDGWYLSDSADNLTKYRISSLSIGAGAYAVVEANSSDFERGANVATFGISPSGEALFLSDPNGNVYDMFETGMQRNGMSSGRIEGDPKTRRVFFTTKTKGTENSSDRYAGYTSEPTFSETALYQTSPFALTLSCLNPNARIYYTTDGSEPSQSSAQYAGPLTISKNTVIRAMTVSDGLLKSDIVTYHYLFEQPHTVPVVCIAMDPDDFNTVYKVKEHKDIKERKCYVNYYESDGLIGTTFAADIKAKGRGTLKYAQKSMSLSLRGAYGQSHVDYPFFPGYEFTRFAAFALRNAGQDYDEARLRDSFVTRACLGLNVDCANSRFCVAYINGVYYGIYDFNEELNSKYLETHFGVDSDSVNTIMRNGYVAMKGTNKVFKSDFDEASRANLSSDSAYQKFIEKVDPDAFIDYVICRQFMLETDSFNQKYWRTTDYKIRWRPILYDLDMCFDSGVNRDISHLYFNKEGTPSNNGSRSYFYFSVALRTNEAWKQKFVERYVELVMTKFSNDTLLPLLDSVVAELEPEMQRHIDRWHMPKSMSVWKNEVAALRSKVEKRPSVVLEQVRKEFKMSASEMDALIAKYQ